MRWEFNVVDDDRYGPYLEVTQFEDVTRIRWAQLFASGKPWMHGWYSTELLQMVQKKVG